MFPGPVYLASDAHLGATAPARDQAFRHWLRHAADVAGTVVINGDLFDFWFEYGSVVPRGHTRTLGLLAEIADNGTPVVVMGGNHDWWGGSFLENEVGVTFLREPTILDLAGWKTLLAHGDGIGQGDLGYRMLSAVIRSRPARWAFRWLHPDIGAWIARGVSLTEARPEDPTPAESARSRTLSQWAEATLRNDPGLDLVTMGHTHVPEMRRVEPGSARRKPGFYVNSGDWVHHTTYVVLLEDADTPRMEEWPLPSTPQGLAKGGDDHALPTRGSTAQGEPESDVDPDGPAG